MVGVLIARLLTVLLILIETVATILLIAIHIASLILKETTFRVPSEIALRFALCIVSHGVGHVALRAALRAFLVLIRGVEIAGIDLPLSKSSHEGDGHDGSHDSDRLSHRTTSLVFGRV